MENQYLGIGLFRCDKQIEREYRSASAFEASNPFFRPPMHLFHGVGKERLLGRELGLIIGVIKLSQECLENVLSFPCLKSEHGGIADVRTLAEQCFVPLYPIVDNTIFAGFVIKETINVVHDYNVQIEE